MFFFSIIYILLFCVVLTRSLFDTIAHTCSSSGWWEEGFKGWMVCGCEVTGAQLFESPWWHDLPLPIVLSNWRWGSTFYWPVFKKNIKTWVKIYAIVKLNNIKRVGGTKKMWRVTKGIFWVQHLFNKNSNKSKWLREGLPIPAQ